MMVTLRLYRQHDLDLITLYRHPSFSLPSAIKKALYAYIRNEKLYIKQPEPYAIGKDKISKTVQMHINLNEDNDSDIIVWLKNIKEGYRNSVLKNIIRAYIVGPCIYSYQMTSSDAIEMAKLCNNTFESNINDITELKGRGYVKSSKSIKKDNKKVEESELAAKILSNDTTKNKSQKVFVERIADDDVDVKQLEAITAKQNIIITEPQNIVQNNDEDDDDLSGMLDMIDEMMNI